MSGTALAGQLITSISCNGVATIITTDQNPGESTLDFQTRHLAAVAAARAGCTGTFTADPSVYTTPVQCTGQSAVDVVTTQGAGQSWADFFAAHAQAVRDALDECP